MTEVREPVAGSREARAALLEKHLRSLPSDAALARGLSIALSDPRPTVVSRQPSTCMSTYPAEVVTCHSASGDRLEILCKYSGDRPESQDHRAGIVYEADVYQRVLSPLDMGTPRYLGRYADDETGWTWLLLEHIEDFRPLRRRHDLMSRTAAWLGEFHARSQLLVEDTAPFLRQWDAGHYLRFVRRTAQFARPLAQQYPWVFELCERMIAPFELLLSRPITVAHGEFTVHNVLVQQEQIRPVDWESAATGAGEIDLAALIEGWPDEFRHECIAAYCRSRWPGSDPPTDFERILDAAGIHLLFRGLGGDPNYTTARETRWRFEELHSAGVRWGLL